MHMRMLLFVVILALASCSPAYDTIRVKTSRDEATRRIKKLAADLKFNITCTPGTATNEIQVRKSASGKVSFTIRENPSGETIIRIKSYATIGADSKRVLFIIRTALNQEFQLKPASSLTRVELKSSVDFAVLTALNSGIGLYYAWDANPYYSPGDKRAVAIVYGLLDIAGTVLIIDHSDKNTLYAGLIINIYLRTFVWILGGHDIRNINQLAGSRYSFPTTITEPNEMKLELPVFSRRF